MMYINTTKEKRKNSYLSEMKFFWLYLKIGNRKKIPFIHKDKSLNIEFNEYPELRIKKNWLKENFKRLLSMMF